MKIFLIGYRCTGKTTIGKILADLMGYSFLDIDKKVETETNSSIASIVKSSGWEEFRRLEQQVLFKTKNNKNLIVSTGGGIVLRFENRNFLKNNGRSIWLFANKEVILSRLTEDENTDLSRPSLTNKKLEQETEMLILEREPLYSEIAQLKFDTSVKTPEKIAQMIKGEL
ncbi:MAG: shikimate kinase [Desulfobacteraceae bacterium]|nr:shikimate kinase [Desulfobacteraceae bacterium]